MATLAPPRTHSVLVEAAPTKCKEFRQAKYLPVLLSSWLERPDLDWRLSERHPVSVDFKVRQKAVPPRQSRRACLSLNAEMAEYAHKTFQKLSRSAARTIISIRRYGSRRVLAREQKSAKITGSVARCLCCSAESHSQWCATVMISLLQLDHPPLCSGYTWRIDDPEFLAARVAELLLGYHFHVVDVLNGTAGKGFARPRMANVQHKLDLLELTTGSETERWHRDGWVFQMISWVAAQREADGEVLIRAPQCRPADKGLDGLLVELSVPSGTAATVVVCEDKATKNPRGMIRDKVWPEILDFEDGARDAEVNSEVTALATQVTDEARRRDIIDALWHGELHYRVSITIPDGGDDAASREALFEGFLDCAPGTDLRRRRAHTLALPSVRTWMDWFCAKVAAELRRIAGV